MTRARPTPMCELRPEWLNRPEREAVMIDLPLCPSVNQLYANRAGIGRIKTRAYRSWLSGAVLYGHAQHPGRIIGLADLVIYLPTFCGDTDGRAKALIDCARTIGVIADDGGKYIRHVLLRRGEAPEGFVRLLFEKVALTDVEPTPEAA